MDKGWRCLLTSVEALLHLSRHPPTTNVPSLVFFAICLQSFYNFQHPSFHNPQKSDIGFHDQRVYFIIIHKNSALCVGRVHTSSYCKTVTLTSTGVVSFFNKNDMKALQFTCRKYISCKFVTVKMPDKIWFANFCYWDKLFIAPD